MARYLNAIDWIAQNDDNEWLLNLDPVSVTVSMVADLWHKDHIEVVTDLFLVLRALYPMTYASMTLAEMRHRYGVTK